LVETPRLETDERPRAGARRAGRTPAAIAAGVLGAGLVTVLVLFTPWRPLGERPVPGGPTAPDPARDFNAAEIARSAAFDAALSWPAYLGLAASLLTICALGFTPLGARFLGAVTGRRRPGDPDDDAAGPVHDRVARCRGPLRGTALRVVGAAVALTAVLQMVGLPFDIWRETIVRDYGLSTQDWPAWALDQLKSFGVSAIMWSIALLGLHLLIRRFPRGWWAGAAAGGFGLVLAVSFGYPVLVEPLFNSFTPMRAGPLRTTLLHMAQADGVKVTDVLVADASRRTTTLNAYVSGFGSTRRVVVYDTLLKSAPPAQVRTIVAHELGHAKNRDVLTSTAAGALGVATGTCLLYVLLGSPRLLRRAGVRSAADPRATALMIALLTIGTLAAGPLQNMISRRIETRADVHALNLTRDPATFASMQRALAVRNVSDLSPDPVEYALWSTHPSTPQRIALARDWARLHGVKEP
jgi:STE24 endopeptidase